MPLLVAYDAVTVNDDAVESETVNDAVAPPAASPTVTELIDMLGTGE